MADRLPTSNDPAALFRHVSAEKAAFYRRIMDVAAPLLGDLRQD
jgi:hypothetical protein